VDQLTKKTDSRVGFFMGAAFVLTLLAELHQVSHRAKKAWLCNVKESNPFTFVAGKSDP
jgi:hypothetical protein